MDGGATRDSDFFCFLFFELTVRKIGDLTVAEDVVHSNTMARFVDKTHNVIVPANFIS